MPSDARTPQALDALAGPIHSFRSTLANTSEQIRLLISSRADQNGTPGDCGRAELGEFAAGRIDAERMSKLLTREEPLSIEGAEIIHRALDTCNELMTRGENLFRVIVEEGDDLRDCIGAALADIGRAYGAARVVALVTQGQYDASEHAGLLERHPFQDWTRFERGVELGLVVQVAGRDLRVGGLAAFLDGAFKLVLIVQGDAPPAPLVRLVTPGVLVLQTAEAAELEWLAGYRGPGVAALVSSAAVQFRHDPDAGPRLSDRVVITTISDQPIVPLGILSVFQQEQNLLQLEAMAEAAAETVVSEPAVEAARDTGATRSTARATTDSADKLSAWLLNQADLSGPS